MYKEKINIIVPSDSLLFDGIQEAVEQGWKDSVGPTIKQFAKKSGKEISPEKIKKYGDIVLAARKAELERRSKNPGSVKYPKNILTTSYAALEEKGDFTAEDAAEMAVIGNGEYLRYYTMAAAEKVSVSNEGKELLKALQSDTKEIKLIRCEHKREEIHLPDGTVLYPMAQETEKLKEIAPGITIDHFGLNPEGSAYIRPLELLKKEEGINIIILPSEKMDAKIKEFESQLTGTAKEENMLILSVSDKNIMKEASGTSIGDSHHVPVVSVKAKQIWMYLNSWAVSQSIAEVVRNSIDGLEV